jgi:hypothetical protein
MGAKTPYHFYCTRCGFNREVPSKEERGKVKRDHQANPCPLFPLPNGSLCREDLLPYLIPLTKKKDDGRGEA